MLPPCFPAVLHRSRLSLMGGALMSMSALFLIDCGRAKDAPGGLEADAARPADTEIEPTSLPDGRRILKSGKPAPSGECQRAADCRDDTLLGPSLCSEVASSGYPICVYQTPEATEPSGNTDGSGDECDGTRPCAEGSCYKVTLFITGMCGLGGANTQNHCRTDSCASDEDCPGGVCGPRGYSTEDRVSGGFIRECIPADCRSNADCSAKPGGVCALVQSTCERPLDRPGVTTRPAQLACVYADGCTSDQDCLAGNCVVADGRALCAQR